MNAFRLVFLLIVLLASALLSFSRETPGVFTRAQQESTERTMQTAAKAVLAAEALARRDRELVARRLADDPMVHRLLAFAGDDSPILRTSDGSSIFSGAVQRVGRDAGAEGFVAALFGLDGEVYTSAGASEMGTTAVELARLAGVQEATSRNRVVHRYFDVNGELYASVALPMETSDHRRGAQLVLAERWGTRGANALRRATGTQLVLFHGGAIKGEALVEDALASDAAALIRRTNQFNASNGDALGLLEYRAFREADVQGRVGERLAALAPVAFPGSASQEFTGAILVLDMPRPGDTLFDILVQGRAWDDGTADLWFSIAAGLLLFFLGLFLHDFSMQRASRHLARDIDNVVTTNDPAPLEVDQYGGFFGPVARAFNGYLESKAQQGASLRRLRDELATTRDELDEALARLEGEAPEMRVSRTTHAPDDDFDGPDATHMTLFSGAPPAPSAPADAVPQAPHGAARGAARIGTPPAGRGVDPHAATEMQNANESSGAGILRPASRPRTPAPMPPVVRPEPASPAPPVAGAASNAAPAPLATPSSPPFAAHANPSSAPTRPERGLAPASASSSGWNAARMPTLPAERSGAGPLSPPEFERGEVTREVPPLPPESAPVERRSEVLARLAPTQRPAAPPVDDALEAPSPLPDISSIPIDPEVTAIPGLQTNYETVARELSSDAPFLPGPGESIPMPRDDERGTVPRATLEGLRHAQPGFELETRDNLADSVLTRAEQRMQDLGLSSFGSAAEDDGVDAATRALFDEYVRVRRENGEPVDDLTLDTFARRLEKNRQALIARHRCRSVRFRVDVANGRTALRATPVN